MRFLEKLVEEFSQRQQRRSVHRRLDAIVDAFTKYRSLLDGTTDFRASAARRRLDRAEKRYKVALEFFKDDEIDECEILVDKVELHLRFVARILTLPEQPKYDSGFADGSIQANLEHLCDMITQTKTSIEYNNCVLSDGQRKDLIVVAALFSQAVDALKEAGEKHGANETSERHLTRAGQVTDAALLLLYFLVLRANIASQGVIQDVRFPKRWNRKAGLSIKELAEQVVDCKLKFETPGVEVTAEARKHLLDAETSARTAIERLANNDENAVDTAVSAGELELKYADKLFVAPRTDSDTIAPSKELKRTAGFRTVAERLIKLMKRTEARHYGQAEKHLNAAVEYFNAALDKAQDNPAEANRLARAAFLDLDYARQLACSEEPANTRISSEFQSLDCLPCLDYLPSLDYLPCLDYLRNTWEHRQMATSGH